MFVFNNKKDYFLFKYVYSILFIGLINRCIFIKFGVLRIQFGKSLKPAYVAVFHAVVALFARPRAQSDGGLLTAARVNVETGLPELQGHRFLWCSDAKSA